MAELDRIEHWAEQGIISQAAAQGQSDKWVRRNIRLTTGRDYTIYEVEDLIALWERTCIQHVKETPFI